MKSKSKSVHYHSIKCIWKCRLAKWRQFCLGLHVLRYLHIGDLSANFMTHTGGSYNATEASSQYLLKTPQILDIYTLTLQWRHYGCDGVLNYQAHHSLLTRLFGRRSKKTPMLRVAGLCEDKRPVTRKLFDDVIMRFIGCHIYYIQRNMYSFCALLYVMYLLIIDPFCSYLSALFHWNWESEAITKDKITILRGLIEKYVLI